MEGPSEFFTGLSEILKSFPSTSQYTPMEKTGPTTSEVLSVMLESATGGNQPSPIAKILIEALKRSTVNNCSEKPEQKVDKPEQKVDKPEQKVDKPEQKVNKPAFVEVSAEPDWQKLDHVRVEIERQSEVIQSVFRLVGIPDLSYRFIQILELRGKPLKTPAFLSHTIELIYPDLSIIAVNKISKALEALL
jgi:23S rRNA-/tRNA-specific pseudouridylate synthase